MLVVPEEINDASFKPANWAITDAMTLISPITEAMYPTSEPAM